MEQTPESIYQSVKLLIDAFPQSAPDRQLQIAVQIRDWATLALEKLAPPPDRFQINVRKGFDRGLDHE